VWISHLFEVGTHATCVFTARRYASAVYAVVLCVCVSVCLSVCLSVRRRYCVKTAKRGITQTTL